MCFIKQKHIFTSSFMDRSIFKFQTWLEQRCQPNQEYSKARNLWMELLVFAYKNGVSCIFPVTIFALLAVSRMLPLGVLPRYDFLLICCLLMQAFLYFTKMESMDEVLVICIFHILGITMEWFKVYHHSWSYPEEAYTKIYGVPLYSGFMYASVASFMCQAWRRFELQMTDWPKNGVAMVLAALVYINFFTHHFIGDYRWILAALTVIAFLKSKVWFTTNTLRRQMPVALSFLLIGFFIWLAENVATFFGAWKYAHQHHEWKLVHLQKIGSWILMSIVSYIIVAQLKFWKKGDSLSI